MPEYSIDSDTEVEKGGSEITEMEILARLLEKDSITLHTTIHNPIGMTAVDQGLALIKVEFGGDIYRNAKVWVDMFRENMVAEDGNRATGIMKAVASKAEERKQSATERMLGELSR